MLHNFTQLPMDSIVGDWSSLLKPGNWCGHSVSSQTTYKQSFFVLPLVINSMGFDGAYRFIYHHPEYFPPHQSHTFMLLFFFFFWWVPWVFVAVCRLSLVVVSGGYSSLSCTGLSLWWFLLLWIMDSRASVLQQLRQTGSAVAIPGLQSTDSIIVAHGLTYSAACGFFLDQASNPCLLHWQVDSLSLSHQGTSGCYVI